MERGAPEPEDLGRALLAADPPMHAFQHVADVFSLDLLQRDGVRDRFHVEDIQETLTEPSNKEKA
jgi:hypothetical protein